MITEDHSFRKSNGAWNYLESNEAYPSLGPQEQLIHKTMASASSSRRPITRHKPLDVYKKIPILRTTEDELLDEHGTHQSISLADLETRDEVVAPVKQAKKLNIPIPLGRIVDDYYTRCLGGYQPPVSYLRHVKKPDESLDPSCVDYVLEKADVLWLRKRGNSDLKLLDEDRLEKAIDVLEKATHLPQTTGSSGGVVAAASPKASSSSGSASASALVEPVSQETAEALLASRLEMPSTSASREVIADVYQYWLAKRTARGRSLLRRFVPPTAPDDTNPHHVFRPREKERYKLRRSRKNDMESFRKMQQLRRELGKVRQLLVLVHHREKVKQLSLAVSEEAFAQQLHDHAAGLSEDPKKVPPRQSTITLDLSPETTAAALALPDATSADYDLSAAAKRKRKRLAEDHLTEAGDGLDERRSGLEGGGDDSSERALRDGVRPPPTLPSFMEPNSSRGYAYHRALTFPATPQSVTAAGAVSNVVDPWSEFEARPGRPPKPSHAIYDGSDSTFNAASDNMLPGGGNEGIGFACRARIGRGGRVIFDRTPIMNPTRPRKHLMVGITPSGAACDEPPVTVAPALLPRGVRRRTDRFDVRRLHRIYAASDSEDEELKPSDKAMALATNTALKYEICV